MFRAIDEVSHEHFRGFSVQIDMEECQGDDGEDSGYVPTPEHDREEVMPPDSAERKEVIPQDPRSHFLEDFEEPQLLGYFCSNTKHVAIGRMKKVAIHVFRHQVGLLQGVAGIRVVMRTVQLLLR